MQINENQMQRDKYYKSNENNIFEPQPSQDKKQMQNYQY
jgi:hypothetical protein